MVKTFGSFKYLWLGLAAAGLILAAVAAGEYLVRSAAGEPEGVVSGQTYHAVQGQLEAAAQPKRQAGEPMPAASIPDSFYDFGRVKGGEIVQRDFYLQNTGDAGLEISRAVTTCGCTTAEFSATEIPPGQTARITLIFDSGFHNLQGATVRRGLLIQTNDPARPQMEIWIQATIR